MSDLVDFLRARLDEDEQMARVTTGPWKYHHETGGVVLPTARHVPELTEIVSTPREPSDARHMVRWDSARVLRMVECDRRLLNMHEPRPIIDPDGKERPDWPERACRVDGEQWMGTPEWAQGEDFEPPEPEYCETLRLLALPYSDHPEFREEWRP